MPTDVVSQIKPIKKFLNATTGGRIEDRERTLKRLGRGGSGTVGRIGLIKVGGRNTDYAWALF